MPMMTQKIISQNPGNWQTVIRSSILATIFILICAYISNHKIFFALDEESPMAKGHFDSMLTLVNDNFMVGFCWLWIVVEIIMSPLWLHFRIPSLLVKWPSLQPYFVTIQSSISGLHQQCKFLFFSTIPMFFLECWLLILLISQGLRGDHWVLYNYIKARKQFQVFQPWFWSHFRQILTQYYIHHFFRFSNVAHRQQFSSKFTILLYHCPELHKLNKLSDYTTAITKPSGLTLCPMLWLLFTHFESDQLLFSITNIQIIPMIQNLMILLKNLVQWVYNLHNPWRLWILGQPWASPAKVNNFIY